MQTSGEVLRKYCRWGRLQYYYSCVLWFPWDRVQKHHQQDENNTSARTHHLCDRFSRGSSPVKKQHLLCPDLSQTVTLSLAIICSLFLFLHSPTDWDHPGQGYTVWLDKNRKTGLKSISTACQSSNIWPINCNILLCFSCLLLFFSISHHSKGIFIAQQYIWSM